MSSPPSAPATPVRRVRKRARSTANVGDALSSPLGANGRSADPSGSRRDSSPESTLPPSSPLPFSEDDGDLLDGDVDAEIPHDLAPEIADDDDDEGEDLFGDNFDQYVYYICGLGQGVTDLLCSRM